MGTLQGTIGIHRASPHRRVLAAYALAIALVVGVGTYALTYRALVVISTPSATTAPAPPKAHPLVKPYPVTPSTVTPLASLPGN
jgi:hypothetical protein